MFLNNERSMLAVRATGFGEGISEPFPSISNSLRSRSFRNSAARTGPHFAGEVRKLGLTAQLFHQLAHSNPLRRMGGQDGEKTYFPLPLFLAFVNACDAGFP